MIFNRWLTELLSEKRALPPPNRRFHALSFSPWQALFGPRQAGKARPPRLGTYRPRRRPPPIPGQPPAYSVFRLDAAKLPFFPIPAHPLVPSLTFHPHSHSQHLPQHFRLYAFFLSSCVSVCVCTAYIDYLGIYHQHSFCSLACLLHSNEHVSQVCEFQSVWHLNLHCPLNFHSTLNLHYSCTLYLRVNLPS